jgi:MFS family permease
MLENRKALLRLLVPYALWNAVAVLGGSFVYLYFKGSGVGAADLVASFFFWAIAPLLVMGMLSGKRRLSMRTLILIGIVAHTISYLSLFLLDPSRELLFAYSFLVGTTCFFFWIPFNTMYFELEKVRKARAGAVYFSVAPLLGIFLPLAGGLIAEAYGFGIVFLMAALLSMVMLVAAFFMAEKRSLSYEIASCMGALKGFRALMLVEGVYAGGIVAAVSVISLFYFTTAPGLGLFLSVTMLFSVLASFVVSDLSDKTKKRKRYIRMSASGLGMATAAAAFAATPIGWASIIALRNFFATLFYPFTTTVLLDNEREVQSSMVGRELLLNSGRIIGIAIVLFCILWFSDIYISLLVLGLIVLSYSLIIEFKKKQITIV